MRTKLNFCGIVEHSPKVLSFGKTQIYLFFRSLTRTFATAFIAATIILVSSCSQDDDFYDSDMYTMAEELETRAGEPGGGYTPTPISNDTTTATHEFLFSPTNNDTAKVFITNIEMKLYKDSGKPVADIIGHSTPTYIPYIPYEGFLRVDNIYLVPDSDHLFMYKMYASAYIRDTIYKGVVENLLFN